MRIGARDADLAGLERLAQRIEHRALEFGELVEEQDAEMREADLARLDLQPAADQRRHRRRMVRRTIRPGTRQPSAGQRARDACHHRHFERLGGIERRQDAGQARRHQRFARSRRPDHQQIVRPRRGDLERALGGFLALDLAQIGSRRRHLDRAGLRRGEQAVALEMIDQRQDVGRRDDPLPAPRRFRALRRRADQPEPALGRVQRGEQHAGRRRDSRVEAQFADDEIVGERLGIDHAHRGEQTERDRQVEMRAFLGQIGGREIDHDPLGRQREPHRRDRPAHALAALANRLVAEPDHVEPRQAGDQLHLDLDRARLEPEIRHRGYARDHPLTPQQVPTV